tara:strand:+ start:298 stop:444 length:147 start_codon:yes stop_codon:yes gene_type:complete
MITEEEKRRTGFLREKAERKLQCCRSMKSIRLKAVFGQTPVIWTTKRK